MLKPTPDLVELNAALLSDPAAISGHSLLRKLAEQDPELGFLCPLARALVQLDRGDCDAAAAEAALGTCWLVDDSAINRPKKWRPGKNLEVVEVVEHRIDTGFQDRTIPLIFRSEADLLYCSEEYKVHITAATAADLVAEHGELTLISTPAPLADWLIQYASDPVGQPEGEDEPLCSIRYQLVRIGNIEVAGPVLEHGYYEITLEDLNEDYEQRSGDDSFCWLHALDASQAEQLGIAVADSTAYSLAGETPSAYPSWVPPAADAEACWITAEQMQESYSKGKRMRHRKTSIHIQFGCGLDWDPRHDSEQFPDEEVVNASLIFPDGHRPLLSIWLDPEVNAVPGEMECLSPYLFKLAAVASTGKGD